MTSTAWKLTILQLVQAISEIADATKNTDWHQLLAPVFNHDQNYAYPLTAAIDELYLQHHGRALKLTENYFNDHFAGEHFFEKLNHLIQEKQPMELIAIYYQILQLGFKGKYHVYHAASLSRLSQDCHNTLPKIPTPAYRIHNNITCDTSNKKIPLKKLTVYAFAISAGIIIMEKIAMHIGVLLC